MDYSLTSKMDKHPATSSYHEIVDRIAAQHAPIQGEFCKELGSVPVWLAPADVCGDDGGLDTTLEVCEEYPTMKTDYSNRDHHLVCVSSEDLDLLWSSGHCHGPNGGEPLLYNDGRLKCSSQCWRCHGTAKCSEDCYKYCDTTCDDDDDA